MEKETYYLWQIIATLFGSFVVLVGLIFSVRHFYDGQKNKFSELMTQNRNSFQKAFWEKQLELYLEATSNAAKLTQEEFKSPKYTEARIEFYKLFWGPMSVVEDMIVKTAMENFSDTLLKFEENPDEAKAKKNLKHSSFNLAKTCRKSSIKQWELKGKLEPME